MQKRLNKKAQDLSIGTLILIVLGIIVLVLLILGFSYGWSNLWEKINIFGGKTSISDVVTNCNLAVTSNARFTYCDEFKQVTIDGRKEYVTCEDPRVASGIENKMTCETKDRVKEQCLILIKQDKVKEDTKINQETCWSKYTCGDLSGTQTAKGNCQTNQPLELNSKAILNLNEEVCCVSR